MQTFVGLLALSLALAVNASPNLSRIVGGSDAPEGKYPYQVSLWKNGKFHCSGSIVNERYILTAAHCINELSAHEITVGVGSQFLDKTVDFYEAERLIPHSEYNPTAFTDDIGLVRLAKKLVFGDKIKPIPVGAQDFTREDYPVTLTGWGKLFFGGPSPNNLQEIELRLFNTTVCDSVINGWTVSSKQMCTFPILGQGACNGDAGAPLVVDGYQIGVMSFGEPCARGKPDVFTRVHAYLEWIAGAMDEYRQ